MKFGLTQNMSNIPKLTRYEIGQCLRLLEGPPGYYQVVGVLAVDMYHIAPMHRYAYGPDFPEFVNHNVILPVTNPLISHP